MLLCEGARMCTIKHAGHRPTLGISSDTIHLVWEERVLSLGLELTDWARLGGLASEGQRFCLCLPSSEIMYRGHYGFLLGRFWARTLVFMLEGQAPLGNVQHPHPSPASFFCLVAWSPIIHTSLVIFSNSSTLVDV